MNRGVVFSRLALVASVVAGCSGGPILANPPIVYPSPPSPTGTPSRPADPIPIAFPLDDGPHDRLTEWWYYTGHLQALVGTDQTPTGGGTIATRRFGFEAVIFRAERGSVPVAWASHLALTDESGDDRGFSGGPDLFHYAQRSEVGPQVDRSPRDEQRGPGGFDLQVSGLSPALIAAGAPPVAPPWRMSGSDGVDRIEAALSPEEATAAGAAFGMALDLTSTKVPALHDDDGFVSFGAAGSSYYYSRTRMAADGQLTLNGETLDVEGIAWFDHQWGDFVSVGGGWDWFAINLDDGTDLTISVVFGPEGQGSTQYGTVVEPDGTVRYLGNEDLGLRATESWTSPTTGRRYPMNWFITIPDFRDGQRLLVNLLPTTVDQELDARPTTGVIYWEGSQRVSATLGQAPATTLGGEAYVEMTRYSDP